MLKKIIKKIISYIGYEVRKKSTRDYYIKRPENNEKIAVSEYRNTNLKNNNGVCENKNLIIKSQFNNLTIREMQTSAEVWGFTECVTGNIKFYMGVMGSDDGVALRFFNNGTYEKCTTNIWTKLACLSKVILDVGAHTGSYTISAMVANPNSKVISFEPHYLNFARLALNLRANGFDPLDIYMVAASDRNESVYFQVPKDLGYHSSGGKIGSHLESKTYDGYWINSISLDSFLIGEAKDSVDLVKIDTEGHELNVLQGMSEIIEKNHPTIFFECITQSNTNLEEFFEKYDYELYCVDDLNGYIHKINCLEPIYTPTKTLDMNRLNRIALHKSSIQHSIIIKKIILDEII